MRAATLLLATLVAAAYAAVMPWEEFKLQYRRRYATTEEENLRRGVYERNMRMARTLNERNPLATFGTNAFADMTNQEFKRRHSAEGYYARKQATKRSADVLRFSGLEASAAAGQTIDWRTKGAVTGVKDQGQCGSCWAFSSTGSIEGQWFLAGNPLTSVSEQELVSCDTVDQGCNGGLMDQAWAWLESAQKGQIMTEASYPYVSGDGNAPACQLAGKTLGSTINGHKDIAHDETQMAAFVYASGPLSVGVDATSWQTYSGGIMTDCISSQVDHGVLVVGYDDTNNPPYWIIKNSWGLSWGENGFIRVQKGTNQCLITQFPCTSTVAKGPGPSPPGPPPPPGPTPPPGPSGTFKQRRCTDGKCSNCTTQSLPQNQCIKGLNGGSVKAQCISDGLLVWNFASSDCSGASIQVVNPIDACLAEFTSGAVSAWITNDCGSGPSPPPGPPNSLVQTQCTSATCTTGCNNYTFPLGKCLKLSDGGSAIAQCNSAGVLLTEYILAVDCTGPSIPDQMEVDKCLQDEDGTYFENFCLTSSVGIATSARTASLRHGPRNVVRA